MPTNDFLPFAASGDANVISQADYIADPETSVGFAAGIAYAEKCNKVWKQSSFVISAVSQFILEELGDDVEDNGNRAAYVTQFREAIQSAAATGGGGFADAPANGNSYGRLNNAWHQVVNVSGDTMSGSLIFGNGIAIGAPDTTGTGERVRLYSPGGGPPNYALGIAGSEFWSGVPTASQHFAWYAGTNLIARLPGSGTPTLGTDLITLAYLLGHQRITLTADKTYYVSPPTGSLPPGNVHGLDDPSHDGSAALPWATIQYAVQYAQGKVDFAGFNVIIRVLPGLSGGYTYTEAATGGVTLGGSPIGVVRRGQLIVQGTPGNPSDVTVHVTDGNCFVAEAGATLWVRHMTLKQTTASAIGDCCLGADSSGVIMFEDINFLDSSYEHLYAAGGTIICTDDYQISGGAQQHALVAGGGVLQLSTPGESVTITLNGAPDFSNAFVVCDFGYIIAPSATTHWAGTSASAGTPKHQVKHNGVIDTQGGGLNFFPGGSNGDPWDGTPTGLWGGTGTGAAITNPIEGGPSPHGLYANISGGLFT